MSLKQIPIAKASDEQLAEYAAVTLQLDVENLSTRQEVIAAIGLSWPNDWITVEATLLEEQLVREDQAGRVVTEPQQRLRGSSGADDPKVIITIGQTEQPGGRDPVPVGVNGHTLVIQRGLSAEMPYRYFLALQNAMHTNYDAVPVDGQPGKYTLIESEVSNYPITLIQQMPSPAEIREWHERVDHLVMP